MVLSLKFGQAQDMVPSESAIIIKRLEHYVATIVVLLTAESNKIQLQDDSIIYVSDSRTELLSEHGVGPKSQDATRSEVKQIKVRRTKNIPVLSSLHTLVPASLP